ncbi:MAG: V-type ATP synthase subunit F [Angelakisella sp.]
MRSSIAVIGEKESVLGFKAVGFSVYETTSSSEAEEVIEKLYGQQVGIIFITEETLAPISHVLERYKDAQLPAIIPIPGRRGSMGLGLSNVKKSVERAVGADILFKD